MKGYFFLRVTLQNLLDVCDMVVSQTIIAQRTIRRE